MKIIKHTFLTLAVVIAGMFAANAQNSKEEKKAAKEAQFKALLASRDFTFNAQMLNGRELTSPYDVRIVKDSVVADLPYFGRASVAPMGSDDAGLRFTSTKFIYAIKTTKSGWDIVIKPTDSRQVEQMIFNLSSNGYATLSVNSYNRDPITFYGYVGATKKSIY